MGGGGGGCHIVLAWFQWLHVVLIAAGPLLLWARCVIAGSIVSDVIPLVVVSLSLSFPSCCLPHGAIKKGGQHPIPPLQAVAHSGRARCWVIGSFRQSLSAISTPNPPCKQSLTVVVMGAGVPIIRPPLLLSFMSSLSPVLVILPSL